jgi:hypothetical protein
VEEVVIRFLLTETHSANKAVNVADDQMRKGESDKRIELRR